MRKQLARILTLTAVLALCAGMLLTASAHNAVADPLGGTYVRFSYSDGTPIKGAKIVVQDAGGASLGAGKTTSEGIYDYAEYEGTAARIIMNDGEGHAVEYEVPEETPPVTDQTPAGDGEAVPAEGADAQPAQAPASSAGGGMSGGTIAAVVVVIAAAAVVAVLFSKRTKRK